MKAVRLIKIGQPLELQEVPLPRVGERDVLIRVKAAGFATQMFIIELAYPLLVLYLKLLDMRLPALWKKPVRKFIFPKLGTGFAFTIS
jgi:hypothetical protein